MAGKGLHDEQSIANSKLMVSFSHDEIIEIVPQTRPVHALHAKENSNIFQDAVSKTNDVESDEDNIATNEASGIKNFNWLSKCGCILSFLFCINSLINTYGYIGKFFFQMFGNILYVIDVTTDIASGINLISGIKINETMFGNRNYDNYTRNICKNLLNHSHPVWGSINIALAWLPGLTNLPTIIVHVQVYSKLPQLHWSKKVIASMIIVAFWPLIGLIL